MTAETTILPHSAQDAGQLAERVRLADQLVRQHLEGAQLDQSLSDLDRIQSLIDLQAVAAEQSEELQSLGAAFGKVLEKNVDGLHWVSVEDEDGSEPALRYQETSLLFFPLTMIANRLEDGREVDVVGMYEFVGDRLAEADEETE